MKTDKSQDLSHQTMQSDKILAIDVGRVRVGLAISDSTATLASPFNILSRHEFEEEDYSALRKLIQEEGVGLVIVGHPLSLDGSCTESSRDAETVAQELKKSLTVPVLLCDERLTSKEARRRLAESAGRPPVGRPSKNAGWKRGQRKRRSPPRKVLDDSAAASVLLQSYLDSLKRDR